MENKKMELLSYISKYRSEIMGYAILGVMIAHIKTICHFPDTIVSKVVGLMCYSVFTGGFVFLSGLGLYSSLNKNSNIKDFFKKRATRLLIPYILISLPYFVFTDVFIGEGFIPFLEHITTVSFWIHGNYSGMWYISLSVVLYLLYPLVHLFIYEDNNKVDVRFSLCIIGLSIIISILSFCFPNYYIITSVAFRKAPLFIIGSYIMFLISSGSVKESCPPPRWLSVLGLVVAIFVCLYVDLECIWIVINAICVIGVSILFEWISKKIVLKRLMVVFRWLGQYTLELYILHLLLYYFFNEIDSHYSNGVHIVVAVAISIILCKPIHELVTRATMSVIRLISIYEDSNNR